MFEPFQGFVDVWIIYKRKEILVTDMPGVPTNVCGYDTKIDGWNDAMFEDDYGVY